MTINNEMTPPFLFKRIILQSLKYSFIFVCFSVIFGVFPLFQNYFGLQDWNNIFSVSDKLSIIFLILAITAFCYKVLALSSAFYEKAWMKTHKILVVILNKIRKSLSLIIVLISLACIIAIASPFHILTLYLNNIIFIFILIAIAWIAIQILYTIEAIIHQKMKDLSLQDRAQVYSFYTKVHIFRNVGVFAISVITLAAILMSFSNVRNIGISLLASAGVITAIIGFSGQKALGSIFSGLQIAIAQPIKIGDTLCIEKQWGVVEEINFTYVILKMRDKKRMIVPISYFLEKKFENWTRNESSLTTSIFFNIPYGTALEPLRAELTRILQESSYWDKNINKLMVNKFNKETIGIRVQMSSLNGTHLLDFKAEVREKLLNFMRNNFTEFSSPS